MRRNGTEEAEDIRLRPTFLAPTGLREHPFGTDLRLLPAARQQVDVASPHCDARLEPCEERRGMRVLHVLQHGDGLVEAPCERVGPSQDGRKRPYPDRGGLRLAERPAVLQQRKGGLERPLAEVEQTQRGYAWRRVVRW